VLFLGGYYPWPGVPLPDGALGALVGFGVMFGKIAALCFVMVWFRATFPRLREDQLQRLSWLVLIPVAILQIIVIAIAKVVST
jgi:NADH-quinone oxidoreductase subunit H